MVSSYRASGEGIKILGGRQMRTSDMYRDIGITFKRSCSKEVYHLRPDAAKAALQHRQRFVCADMAEYWCEPHQGWHIGHKNKRRLAREMFWRDYLWFTVWEAESNGGTQAVRAASLTIHRESK